MFQAGWAPPGEQKTDTVVKTVSVGAFARVVLG